MAAALARLDRVPSVALAIYAHPGDAEVSCGATLAAWAASGSEVHLLVCALGEKGAGDDTASATELAKQRAGEVERSAVALGLSAVHGLSHPDGELENDVELRGELVAHVRALRPEVVVCPDPTAVFFGEHYINHRDHRIVGWAGLDAIAPAAAMARYFPAAGPAHAVSFILLSGSLESGVFVDVGTTIDRKAEAVAHHESQLGEDVALLGDAVHQRAARLGRTVGVEYAEAFRRVVLAE